jgi:hypothetical protein
MVKENVSRFLIHHLVIWIWVGEVLLREAYPIRPVDTFLFRLSRTSLHTKVWQGYKGLAPT